MILCYIFTFILLILIFLMKILQNRIVGYIGEKFTAKNIKNITNGVVFHDVYVKGSHGVQQIDIIAVTEKGILVVEKKTYIGLILGRAYDKQWKVCTGRGKKQFFMKNPHHQNFGHIRAICENIPQAERKCIDVVVFGNNAKLGDNIPAGTVLDANFDTFYHSLPHLLNFKEMQMFADKISSLNLDRTENKKLHKAKIRGEW